MTTGLHDTFLFGKKQIAAVDHLPGKFQHQFGGVWNFQGTSTEDCDGLHVHLIYLFDLSDPTIPVEVMGIRWLPLFYCFDFQVNTIGYQLIDDQTLHFFFDRGDPNTSDREEWPGDDFPMQFPASAVKVSKLPYDASDVDDAYMFSGIFGVDELSSYDWEVLKQQIAEETEALLDMPLATEEEFREQLQMPFLNGVPESRCMNPACENARESRQGQLKPMALIAGSPAEDIHLFGEYGDYASLYFQLCETCQTMRVDVC